MQAGFAGEYAPAHHKISRYGIRHCLGLGNRQAHGQDGGHDRGATLCHGHGDDLALSGKARDGENRGIRLVHLLVCDTDDPDVFGHALSLE